MQLELDLRGEPIQGLIGHRDDAELIPFTGWLELMAAITKLTGSSGNEAAAQPHTETTDRNARLE